MAWRSRWPFTCLAMRSACRSGARSLTAAWRRSASRADTRADIALALSEACANVVQHAGPGEEYEVQVSARDRRCTIEVVNAGSGNGEASRPAGSPSPTSRWPMTAEHGRGLKIIEAVVDNLQLTGNGRQGTTVHFEKTLEWVPGAAGQHLFSADVEGSDPALPIP